MSKLLLIDDEEDVRYSLQRILAAEEIELATAASGEEGLKIIPKFKPDLVLMDVRMTGMTGMETLRKIRATHPKLLVILMTAYGTTQTAIEAMKLGAYDYLLKPFDALQLKETIAHALKAARDMQQVVSYEPLLQSEDYELGIIGRSRAMQQVFKLIGQIPPAAPPAEHVLAARPEGGLLVWNKRLPRTDALQVNEGSHHVGGVRLTQAEFENPPGQRIDQTTYFRNLFREFQWEN